jgi:(p)ppGpp synthase/HD superfamily hydrolase
MPSLVIEAGGTQTQAIAALLHDAAEDRGGEQTLAEIRDRFGPQVAEIVAECSDTFEEPKPRWQFVVMMNSKRSGGPLRAVARRARRDCSGTSRTR